jgi:hypothetical protein
MAQDEVRASAMTRQEILAGYVLTGLAPVAFVVTTVGIDVAAPPILVIGGVTVMLLAGTVVKHRLLAGTGSILLSSVLSAAFFVVGIPYLAFATVLLYRMTKINGEQARRRAEERRKKVAPARVRSEVPVRKGKRGGRVTPPGTPPRPKRR